MMIRNYIHTQHRKCKEKNTKHKNVSPTPPPKKNWITIFRQCLDNIKYNI